MSLVLTDRRLLSVSIGSPIGMGIGGEVKEIVGSAALDEVAAFEGSRATA